MDFLGICLSGVIDITNSNGDNVSPWNILLWIFTSAKLIPTTHNSALQFFVVFLINFITLLAICIFEAFGFSGPHRIPF